MTHSSIHIGSTSASTIQKEVKGALITIGNEQYYKISNSNAMRPFLMSLVSDSDHWMFISSNGALTAGRKNSDYSLFPYYTDDKITESSEITGSKSIFKVTRDGKSYLWEPFSERYQGIYDITQNLYKNAFGNKVIFEEHNEKLGLTFRYQWSYSNSYGFVRKCDLINTQETSVQVTMLDGVQNVIPYGVGADLQNASSNLVDAYKRSELIPDCGLGIYALSAIIVDRAEPSEALKCNTVWSLGIDHPTYLLSSQQLEAFRLGDTIIQEEDVKAEKGAYFIQATYTLASSQEKQWMLVAEVNQSMNAVIAMADKLRSADNLWQLIEQDIDLGTEKLKQLTGSSDAMQLSANKLRNLRHYSNTLFNIMRGGIFDNNYQIEKWDFMDYMSKANKQVFIDSKHLWDELPESFSQEKLKSLAYASSDRNFRRLSLEYMPLKFSRRHGDPSRPWNKFSINTRNEIDGSKILDYEGNWRDIFQNWEALSLSFPEFLESMIHKFLNATTFDGYNPYRVTKDGFDWEAIEEHDPWSYIGYWGDHQIIYLLKFLEILEDHYPGKLAGYFSQDLFVYADVPYKIKPYEDILKDPKDTIDFDYESDKSIREKRSELGADGALLRNAKQVIHKVNFIEKILATVLAKMSNFIPEGGIWMNTQRPEWNDANNALVGNGVSMVTLCYLRRFLTFFGKVIQQATDDSVAISEELYHFYETVVATLDQHKSILSGRVSNADRKTVLDGLGQAASQYRWQIYDQTFSGNMKQISLKDLALFIETACSYLEHSIEANKRSDDMYHAYNLMTVKGNEVAISYLQEMLEGQVAALSSGYLSSEESLELLDGLKASALFRDDQYSYLLYPNKALPKFLEKNTIPKEAIEKSELLNELIENKNGAIVQKDLHGHYHFNGNFNNANSLNAALDALESSSYGAKVKKDRQMLLDTFEEVFNHKAFTGRSGTFYGYEGLGSIYWHMVSKLLVATQEVCLKAIREGASAEITGRLLEHYYEINEGIGVHKSPKLYGAFPTDPYSHTPAGRGAQQPGMTGQVKEDILCRFGELGVFVEKGSLFFDPCMLRKTEFLKESKSFAYVDVSGDAQEISVPNDSICFTYCQVPVIYRISENEFLSVHHSDGSVQQYDGLKLDQNSSHDLFKRSGKITMIVAGVLKTALK
ncbi:MAG: hypothetical protein KTR22_01030 [Flavobacteriaceae bacterium]|nr:hypothetical protein [Flavobacteriaceae bacterium]